MPKITEIIADMFVQNGLTHIFGLPGGVAPFLFEEFFKRPNEFTTVVAHHEGAAAVMADMYGRMTGKPGILIGQGIWMATNGGFGIVESYFAGIPLVIITEYSDWYGINHHGAYQSGTGEYGTVDLRTLYGSYSKYVTEANSPKELLYAIQLAIKHATSGRPGPAVVIAKWNVMLASVDSMSDAEPPLWPLGGYLRVNPPCISRKDAEIIANKLIRAKKPVMICGRGTFASKAHEEVLEIAELLGMPVATSYGGKGIIAETHDLALGTTGTLSQLVANEKIEEADVILVVGSALAPDNTMNCSSEFIDPIRQKIIQIDIESQNAGWTYPIDIGVTSDAKLALQEIIRVIRKKKPIIDVRTRINDIIDRKKKPENNWFHHKMMDEEDAPLNPEVVVKIINELIREEDKLVLGAGNNRMWFTKLFQTKAPGQLIGPFGAAGMGWASSASMTSSMIYKEGKTIAIEGDGSMLMCLYNFETMKQYELDPIIIIINNGCYGNVRDYLSSKGRIFCDYEKPNFAAIAEAMGLKGVKALEADELRKELKDALTKDYPIIIDCEVKPASHMRIRTMKKIN